MFSAPISASKAHIYSLSSTRYQAAFSTAETVRLFSFFTRPVVYPFWFFHLYHPFDDDLRTGDRMRKYVQDVSCMVGVKGTDGVVWQELVLELRSQALQHCFTALCHHTFFDTGTAQERLMARAASLLEMQNLREQTYKRGDMLFTEWLDQAIHTAKQEVVTQPIATRMASERDDLRRILSNLHKNEDLTVYWGLFTNGSHLMRGYVAFGSSIRWSYLGADFTGARQHLTRDERSSEYPEKR